MIERTTGIAPGSPGTDRRGSAPSPGTITSSAQIRRRPFSSRCGDNFFFGAGNHLQRSANFAGISARNGRSSTCRFQISLSRSAGRIRLRIAVAGTECRIANDLAFLQSCGQLAFGSLIDRVDARAGKDIMELIQQEDLPQTAKCFFRV